MLHIKKIKPLFTSVITTADKFEEDVKVGGIIQQDQTQGSLKLYQKVLAVGPYVKDISVGDMVMINPAAYIHRKYDKNSIQNDLNNNPKLSVEIPTFPVYGDSNEVEECLLINDRDVQFVYEGEEVDDTIIIPNKKIILN